MTAVWLDLILSSHVPAAWYVPPQHWGPLSQIMQFFRAGAPVQTLLCSTSQLPFKSRQVPSNRDRQARNGGTLGGAGTMWQTFMKKEVPKRACAGPAEGVIVRATGHSVATATADAKGN